MNLPSVRSVKNADVAGKKVLVRVDLNVPMSQGKVTDKTRIERIIPTIKDLIKRKARVVIISHFGRPKGKFNRDLSLAPLTNILSEYLGVEMKFAIDSVGWIAQEAVNKLQDGEVILLENLRFHPGEEKNENNFSDALAELGDIYVNDAFSCSHRSHTSIVGVTEKLESYAGYLLQDELNHLEKTLGNPAKPIAAIIGGSKISTKLGLLKNLTQKMDMIAIGGGMANTFLAAQNIEIGNSLCEKNMVKETKKILKEAEKNNCKIMLPIDAVIADDITNPKCKVVKINKIPKTKMILDIGPESVINLSEKLKSFKTVVWNGPVGAFEYKPYDIGCSSIARMIASLTTSKKVTSVAGGGDVLASIENAGLCDSFSYISTAGGAFLEWLEGKELVGIKALVR